MYVLLPDVEPLCHSELLFAMGYLQVSEGDTVKDSALGHSRARKVHNFSMECVCTLGNGRCSGFQVEPTQWFQRCCLTKYFSIGRPWGE